jgi:formylglycine-generating enzyme required for sulfatase activity
MKSLIIAIASGLAGTLLPAAANNIIVSNVSIADQDSVTKTANIVFDLSWENSWRLNTGPANWDAAWVFVKYHNGNNVWRHAKLGTLAANHVVPAGAELSVGLTGANATGVFIYRAATGSGNNSWSGIKLKWDYGADGILDSAIITADVQAIEMVYVPQGAFYVGDGATGSSYCRGDNRSLPFQITSNGPIEIGNTAAEIGGRDYNPVGGAAISSSSIYPPVFPNGFSAFYCMKYEVSQGQFARALNMGLPYSGNLIYTGNGVTSATSRQIFTGSTPNLVATTPDRAFTVSGNYMLSAGVREYLSWTGLRPMTAFEYEKACRGPVYPVGGEYAWGTAVAASLPYTLINNGLPTEQVGTNYDVNKGNCWYLATNPLPATENWGLGRVGMFAKASYAAGSSPRIQSGSSYWGIMDLTGNVGEPVVDAIEAFPSTQSNYNSNPSAHIQVGSDYYYYEASSFRGSNGNGTATAPADWPYPSAPWGQFAGTVNGGGIQPVSGYPSPYYSTSPVNGIRGVRGAP